jgi:hypothetical protein
MAGMLYDRDYYTWTQDQAARLRDLAGDNRLDVENLAEEVADLGRAQLNKVDSHLRQLLIHLLLTAWIDEPELQSGWMLEIGNHHADARKAFSPGMRQHLDLAEIWATACRLADLKLKTHGDPRLPAGIPCPFALDDLIAPDFDPDSAVETVRRRLAPGSAGA